MKNILVTKTHLLEKLKENRAAHRGIFEEAVEGYRSEAVKQLEAHIERIKSGKMPTVFVRLEAPEDHTDEYDVVIGMLEMDLDDRVELTQADYRAYVMDDWNWKNQFLTSNSLYSGTARASLGE